MSTTTTRRRATLKCRTNAHQDIAHGCGAGNTPSMATDAALAEARLAAQAAADAWMAAQVCPIRCPVKRGAVTTPPKSRAKRRASHKVISRNKLVGPNIGQNGGGPIDIYRVCVAILWQAEITCKGGFEDQR